MVIYIPGDDWYIVYYHRSLSEISPRHKEICIGRMFFDKAGFVQFIEKRNSGNQIEAYMIRLLMA